MDLRRNLFILPNVMIFCVYLNFTETETYYWLGQTGALLCEGTKSRPSVCLCTCVIRSYSGHHQRRERQETHNSSVTSHLSVRTVT